MERSSVGFGFDYIPDLASMNLSSKLKVAFVVSLTVSVIDVSDLMYVEMNAQASSMAAITVRFFSADG